MDSRSATSRTLLQVGQAKTPQPPISGIKNASQIAVTTVAASGLATIPLQKSQGFSLRRPQTNSLATSDSWGYPFRTRSDHRTLRAFRFGRFLSFSSMVACLRWPWSMDKLAGHLTWLLTGVHAVRRFPPCTTFWQVMDYAKAMWGPICPPTQKFCPTNKSLENLTSLKKESKQFA